MKKAVIIQISAAAILYFVFARLGLILSYENSGASPVWPAAGINFYMAVVYGYHCVIGTFIGSAAANILYSGNVPSAVMIALGSSLAAVFYKYTCQGHFICRNLDNLIFCVSTAFFCCFFAAVVGLTAVMSHVSLDNPYMVLQSWTVGDFLGVLTVYPFLVSLHYKKIRKKTVILFTVIITVQYFFVFMSVIGAPFFRMGSETVNIIATQIFVGWLSIMLLAYIAITNEPLKAKE
jgi:integral membrane sensor domain MASE1